MKNDPDSVYYRSLRHWLGMQPRVLVPSHLKWILATTLGLLLLTGCFSCVLQRQVSARTRDIALSEQALAKLARRQENLVQVVQRLAAARDESAVPDIVMEVDSHKTYTWANQTGETSPAENPAR